MVAGTGCGSFFAFFLADSSALRRNRAPTAHSLSATNQVSTRFLAQGVLRRKVRLDLMLGSWLKQRMGIRSAIASQPWRATSSLRIAAKVMQCKGSRCCGDGSSMICDYLGGHDGSCKSATGISDRRLKDS